MSSNEPKVLIVIGDAAETVDTQVDATLPSVLLKKRLAMRLQA